MKKQNILLIVPFVIFLIVILILWGGISKPSRTDATHIFTHSVPSFKLPSLMDPNKDVDQNIFKGKITLLNVWSSWCLYCQQEHAYLNQLAKKNADMNTSTSISLVGLNYHDSLEDAQQWVKVHGNPFHEIIIDKENTLSLDLGVYGTPESFLIDPKGIIRYRHIGPLDAELWQTEFVPIIQNIQNETKN